MTYKFSKNSFANSQVEEIHMVDKCTLATYLITEGTIITPLMCGLITQLYNNFQPH